MHTTELGNGITAHHNGDFSGNVFLRLPAENGGVNTVEIPFSAMARLVAEACRRERMAKLENAGVEVILGIRIK